MSYVMKGDKLTEAMTAPDALLPRLAEAFRTMREVADLPDYSATDEYVAERFVEFCAAEGLVIALAATPPASAPRPHVEGYCRVCGCDTATPPASAEQDDDAEQREAARKAWDEAELHTALVEAGAKMATPPASAERDAVDWQALAEATTASYVRVVQDYVAICDFLGLEGDTSPGEIIEAIKARQ